MKRFLILLLFLFPVSLFAENHGLTLTWTASPSASSCTGTCIPSYNILEGSSAGNESTTVFANTTSLTYTDDGPLMNSYLGTTRCYVIQFQEIVSGLTLNSANSNEVCFSFPAIPAAPSSLSVIAH